VKGRTGYGYVKDMVTLAVLGLLF